MFSVVVTCFQKCQIIFCRHSKSLENHEKDFKKLLEYSKIFCKIFCGHPVEGLPPILYIPEMRGRTEITIQLFFGCSKPELKIMLVQKPFFPQQKICDLPRMTWFHLLQGNCLYYGFVIVLGFLCKTEEGVHFQFFCPPQKYFEVQVTVIMRYQSVIED